MEKILKVGEPISATYSHAAHTLSILAEEMDSKQWLMNCFIQLFGGGIDFLDYQDFGFMECPIIHTQHIGLDMVDRGWNSRIDFIKDAILENYYVYAELNINKISAYGRTVPFAHDALIYGFDENTGEFLIADFLASKRYERKWIPESELRNSLYEGEGAFGKTGIFYDDIFLLKIKKDERAKFSPKKVRESLIDYISGTPIMLGYNNRFKPLFIEEKDEYFFGINCYQLIYNMLNNCNKGEELPNRWRQVIYLFYEHKKIMCERLEFMKRERCLKNADYHIERYQKIKNRMQIILNLFLKYSITYKKDILEKIFLELENINSNERKIIEDLISDIIKG